MFVVENDIVQLKPVHISMQALKGAFSPSPNRRGKDLKEVRKEAQLLQAQKRCKIN